MAVAYNPGIVTDGLVLCLDAANRKSYPGTGTGWNDLCGGKGFNIGGSTFSNSLISFNGGTSFGYESVTDSYPFSFTVPNTIQIGIFPTKMGDSLSNCGDRRMSIWTKQFLTYYGHRLFVTPAGFDPNASTGSLSYQVYGSTAPASLRSLSTTISPNTFYEITTQYIPNSTEFYIKLFVNGNFISASTTSSLSILTNEQFRIGGRDNNCTNGSFVGNIYYFKMYNKELSNQEISQNFNALRGRFGI